MDLSLFKLGFEMELHKVAKLKSMPGGYEKYYTKNDDAHGIEHINEVRRIARMLANKHAPQHKDVVDMAASLHDIAVGIDRERHEDVGAKIVAKDEALKEQLGKRKHQILVHAIKEHRASTGRPTHIVGKILSDADRVASSNTRGAIDRMIQWRKDHQPDQSTNEMLMDCIEHAKEKYSPGAYGRRHYFPETDRKLGKTWNPILRAEKTKDPVAQMKRLWKS